MKILIVDDDSDLLRLYAQVFLNASHIVDSTLRLNEAEKLVTQNKYDIILLDLMFHDNNSLNLIRKIRMKNSPNFETPILALTNLDSGEITKKAMEYGANECLFKATLTPKIIFDSAIKLSKNYSSDARIL